MLPIKQATDLPAKCEEYTVNMNGIIVLKLPYYQHVLNEHGFENVAKFDLKKDQQDCQQLIYAHPEGFIVGIAAEGDRVDAVRGSCCRKETGENRMIASQVIGFTITAFDGRENLDSKLDTLKAAEQMPKPRNFDHLHAFKFAGDYSPTPQGAEGQLVDDRSLAQIRFDQMPDWVKELFDQNENLLPQSQPAPKL
jgi:hypothetical protein